MAAIWQYSLDPPKSLLRDLWGERVCQAVRWVCAQFTLTSQRLAMAARLREQVLLPWAQCRAKRKKTFSKAEARRKHTEASLLWTRSFSGLFSLNILLQEREAQIQTFLKHSGGFKAAVCLIFTPPCFCSLGSPGATPATKPGAWLEGPPHPSRLLTQPLY